MRVVRTWNGVLTMQVTDPVCRRSIPLETVEAHREFLGWSYFFCSAQCVRRFDQRPENVGVVAIDPLFARMRVERKRSDPLDGVSDWFVTIGEIPALNPCGLPAVTGRTVAVANP